MEQYDLTDLTLPKLQCDILLKNGRVIDPELGLDGVMDVAIADDAISAVAPDITGPCFDVIDCAGKIITPGIVDAHAHCYPSTHMGMPPDTCGIYGGVTTVIDGGSTGYMTYPDFHNRYITRCATDVYALLHFNPLGQASHGLGKDILPETWNPGQLKVQSYRVAETVNAHRDRIVGIKNRAIESFVGHKGIPGLEEQLRVCEQCGIPYVLHIGDDFPKLSGEEVTRFTRGMLERMRPGDVIAHAFTGKKGMLFHEDGSLDELVRKAVDRGVLLDASVGKTNFNRSVFLRALERGFKPDLISSDFTFIGLINVNRHFGLTISRFLALGVPLPEIVSLCTCKPAKALGLSDRKGNLAVGRMADISVFDVFQGDYTFMDRNEGEAFPGEKILSPAFTVRNGRVYHAIHKGDSTP